MSRGTEQHGRPRLLPWRWSITFQASLSREQLADFGLSETLQTPTPSASILLFASFFLRVWFPSIEQQLHLYAPLSPSLALERGRNSVFLGCGPDQTERCKPLLVFSYQGSCTLKTGGDTAAAAAAAAPGAHHMQSYDYVGSRTPPAHACHVFDSTSAALLHFAQFVLSFLTLTTTTCFCLLHSFDDLEKT